MHDDLLVSPREIGGTVKPEHLDNQRASCGLAACRLKDLRRPFPHGAALERSRGSGVARSATLRPSATARIRYPSVEFKAQIENYTALSICFL